MTLFVALGEMAVHLRVKGNLIRCYFFYYYFFKLRSLNIFKDMVFITES